MQTGSQLPASTGESSSPTRRPSSFVNISFAPSADQPRAKNRAQSSNDLGSDDEWQFRDGCVSDDDLDVDDQPNNSRSYASDNGHTTAATNDGLHRFQWNRTDGESLLEELNNAPLPHSPPGVSLTSAVLNEHLRLPSSQSISIPFESLSSSVPTTQNQEHLRHLSLREPQQIYYGSAPAPAAPSPPSLCNVDPSSNFFTEHDTSSSSNMRPLQFTESSPSGRRVTLPHRTDLHPLISISNRLSQSSSPTCENGTLMIRRDTAEDEDEDEYDLDDPEQLLVIPGYRGVSSRVDAVDYPQRRSQGWADRPRGPTGAHAPLMPPESSSGQSSPATVRLHRVGSDSAVSSQGGSIGSGSAIRLSTRSSSEASDMSRRMAPKSVSFIPPSMDGNGCLLATSASEEAMERAVISLPSLPHGRGSMSFKTDQSVSRMSATGGEAKHHSSTLKTYAGGGSTARALTLPGPNDAPQHTHDMSSEISTSPSGPIAEGSVGVSRGLAFASNSGLEAGVNQRLSSKSDVGVYNRQTSDLPLHSNQIGRPLNGLGRDLQHGMEFVSNGSTSVRRGKGENMKTTSSLSTMTTTMTAAFAMGGSTRRDLGRYPMSAPDNSSFLECVAQILKGTSVYRRKNFMQATESMIWLTPDLKEVRYKNFKKGNVPVVAAIELLKVRRLKGTDRDVVIESEGHKKPVDFSFPSREVAGLWLSGLCCLIPSNAVVKCRNKILELPQTYDPLLDTWDGRPLAARKRLHEYILLGSIGRGSFGKVKLALASTDLQFYAVKVLSKAMMRKRRRIRPFDPDEASCDTMAVGDEDVNEAVVLKDLRHENVMCLKTTFNDKDKDLLYIVVEYLAKGPIMNSSKLTGAMPVREDRARIAFVDVLCGLEYLHRNSVAHRDIKPDNLLQAGDGTVKISDFGAAVKYRERESGEEEKCTNHGNTVGTPAFTAPELCISEKSPPCPARCYAADIWSLGATLFYLLYGRAPFIAKSVFEMYDAICTQPLVFPESPYISRAAQMLIKQMLNKSPRDRISYDRILRADWLKDCVEVASKLSNLRTALLMNGPSNSSANPGTAVDSVATAQSSAGGGAAHNSRSLLDVNGLRLRSLRR